MQLSAPDNICLLQKMLFARFVQRELPQEPPDTAIPHQTPASLCLAFGRRFIRNSSDIVYTRHRVCGQHRLLPKPKNPY